MLDESIITDDLYLLQGLFYIEKYKNKIIIFCNEMSQELIEPIEIKKIDDDYWQVEDRTQIFWLNIKRQTNCLIILGDSMDIYISENKCCEVIKFIENEYYI